MASFTLPTLLCFAVLSSMALVSHGAVIGLCQDPCPEGWVSHNDRCFLYVADKKTWLDAELNCLSLGGNLASEHSEDEHQFLKDLFKSHDSSDSQFWIGLYPHEVPWKERAWLWSDGTSVDFTIWSPGEPNNFFGGEGCVESNYGGHKNWNDVSCEKKSASFCVLRPLPTIQPGCLQVIPPSNQPHLN